MTRRKDRREFAGDLALLAASPLAIPRPALAGQPAPPPPNPNEVTVQALMEILRARFGKHLGDQQLQQLRSRVRGEVFSAQLLKNVRLANSEEPAFVFQADLP